MLWDLGTDHDALLYRWRVRNAAMLAPPVIFPKEYPQSVTGESPCGHPHPDLKDVPVVRALLPHRRKARNDKLARGKGMQPYPVYVATLPDGTEQRLSFWSAAGKPIDFAAGYNVSLIVGRAVPVSDYVDYAGERIEDPFFSTNVIEMPKARKESAASRLAAICRALNEGEIEAALLMARAA